MKYSQSDEELYVLQQYEDKPTGKFVDVGSYDVFRFSNVRALFEKGWRGVMVEPQPANYKAIADHYAGNERIEVLNFAVGDPAGEIDFYESNGDAVGTTDEEHMKKWSGGGVQYTKIKVPQMGVVEFMEKYARDADFLNIDTEATNMVVFRNTPDWVWEQISMLVIEHDNCQDEIENKLEGFGFTKLYLNGENIIMAKV